MAESIGMISTYSKSKSISTVHVFVLVATIATYYFFAYNLVRTEYLKLLCLYVILWGAFIFQLKNNKSNLKYLTVSAFLLRAVFLLAIPNLSQDFYRFIWDGRMLLEGLNPYLYTPESFINSNDFPVAQAQELYDGMGELNGSHFTNYPPIKQLCFSIAALFAGHSILGSVVVLRLLIIAADFGTLFFGKKLLEKLNLPVRNIFWYVLNPFIIIELTGNLHFEGIMVFFLIWSLYLLHQKKWVWAAVVFALSISVKLVPLLFLPLFFNYFKNGAKHLKILSLQKNLNGTANTNETSILLNDEPLGFSKLILFYGLIGITIVVLFAPFFSMEFISNYSNTVALWFNKFEFNASIYYVIREMGYLFRGYNEIAIIGKILAFIVFLSVCGLALLRRNCATKQLLVSMLFAFTTYLFLSTTVHPWYLVTLLVLAIFTDYKFPLVWSFIIILSYLAYLNPNSADKSENLCIIAIEYAVVYSVFIFEVITKKKYLKSSRH